MAERMPIELSSNPPVACIVLNWNGWQHTIDCLDALKESTYPELNVIVVDNGSTDDSVARIRASHPDILLIESGKNLGFAGGNNIGIRYALAHGADYVWLLNNDTKPAPDALSALVAKALTDRRIGAVASICYYADAPSKVQAWAGTRVNLWIGYVRNSTVPHEDEWFEALYGASLLIARGAMEDAGLLDEGFFLYWEETEFCLRLRKKGWQLAAAPNSSVLHEVSASIGGNALVLDRYFTASGLNILRLHSPAPHLASLLFLTVRFARRLLRLQFARCTSVWGGARDHYDGRHRSA
jgi:GT2 family glycosyltransferase